MKGKTGVAKKMMAGGMTKKMMAGGALPMVEKDGKKVPAFAADGKGKMAAGGMTKKMMAGGMMKKGYAAGGATGLKQHAAMPASKAHKGLKKGGNV
jgi:hypothetical protein